jgi:hypothetical protein
MNRALFVVVLTLGCGTRTIDDGYLDEWRDGGVLPDDTSPASDTATTIDTAPVANITCGMTTCDASSQDCCVTMAGAKCAARGTCSGFGAALSCSSPKSCPAGNVCCFRASGTGGAAKCESSCMGGRTTFPLCETDADCTGGTRCQSLFGGLRGCR